MVGLATGGGTVFLWAGDRAPTDPDSGPDGHALPIQWVEAEGAWNSSDAESYASHLRVVELGSTTGAVAVHEATELCARVVDGQGGPVPGATVTFSASAGRVPVPRVDSSAEGIACAQYEAPGEAGSVDIEAVAQEGDNVSRPAHNLVEVIGHQSHDHGGSQPATVPFSPATVVLAVVVASAGFLHPRRR